MVNVHLRNRLVLGYLVAALCFWAVGESRLWWMRTKLDAKAVLPWEWQAVLGWHPASGAPIHRGRRRRSTVRPFLGAELHVLRRRRDRRALGAGKPEHEGGAAAGRGFDGQGGAQQGGQ